MGAEVACRKNVAVEPLGPVVQSCPAPVATIPNFSSFISPDGCFDLVYGDCSMVERTDLAPNDATAEVAAAKGPNNFLEAAGQVIGPTLAILGTAVAVRYAPKRYSADAAKSAIDRAIAPDFAANVVQKIDVNYRLWHRIDALLANFRWTAGTPPAGKLAFRKGPGGLLVRIHNGLEFTVPFRSAQWFVEKVEKLAGL